MGTREQTILPLLFLTKIPWIFDLLGSCRKSSFSVPFQISFDKDGSIDGPNREFSRAADPYWLVHEGNAIRYPHRCIHQNVILEETVFGQSSAYVHVHLLCKITAKT
jgi:hypothetical protein